MTDDSRAQGGLICVAVVVLGALFAAGLLSESYWALAVPVAALTFFVLGLAFWVGWTIATIRVDADGADPGDPAAGGDAASGDETARPEGSTPADGAA